ncbi:MAG: hypothetical protein RR400_00340, partial [Clostridia bacterium]
MLANFFSDVLYFVRDLPFYIKSIVIGVLTICMVLVFKELATSLYIKGKFKFFQFIVILLL